MKNFVRLYSSEKEVDQVLRVFIHSLPWSFTKKTRKKAADGLRAKAECLELINTLTPEEIEVIWFTADPFGVGFVEHQHGNIFYNSVLVNVIRDLSAFIVRDLADHELEENPVWERYLHHKKRWLHAVKCTLARNFKLQYS